MQLILLADYKRTIEEHKAQKMKEEFQKAISNEEHVRTVFKMWGEEQAPTNYLSVSEVLQYFGISHEQNSSSHEMYPLWLVVAVLTPFTLLHSACDLKSTNKMNMQHCLFRELMLYEFKLNHNTELCLKLPIYCKTFDLYLLSFYCKSILKLTILFI